MNKNMKKCYMFANEEWTCKDIRKPEIISVYGVMEKCFSNRFMINEEMYNAICEPSEEIEIIAESEDAMDYTCYEVWLVKLSWTEESIINVLKNSGITFKLQYIKGDYVLLKDYYNMNNTGVETQILYTDDLDKDNCTEDLSEEEEEDNEM